MGYLLIQQAQVYSTALNKWNQRDIDDQTWEEFKSHFREAQKALCRTGVLTIKDTLNHTEIINLVQQGVQQALDQQQQLSTPPSLMAPAPATCLPALEETSEPSSTLSVNSIASDLTMQTLQQNMEMMKKMMDMMNTNNKPKKSRRRNPYLTKYCHTHGLCNHNSPDCHTPAEGHKNEATLQNRLGGSTKNIS